MINQIITSTVCSIVAASMVAASRPMVARFKEWGESLAKSRQEELAGFGVRVMRPGSEISNPVPVLTGTDELPSETPVSSGTSDVVYTDAAGTTGTATVSVTMSSGTACVVYTDAATGVTGTADIQ